MKGTSLVGRTAVVTGGAGGIGQAICADLAALGARVVVADLDEAGAAATAKALNDAASAGEPPPMDAVIGDAVIGDAVIGDAVIGDAVIGDAGTGEARTGEAIGVRVDLGDQGNIGAFAARVGAFGGADVLVHNAGVSIVDPFVDSDPAGWDLMWRINLRAPMLLTKALLPGMIERGWGRLIFISSDGARAGSGGEGAYAATKAGLFGLAKTLAREAARAGVTSNVVCPGPTDTPMVRRVAERHPGLLDKLAGQIPLRRIGRPDDVAGLVAFLCTERAAYITGQVLSVSGGITMS
jgi:2-hydroxycyclohexanecarboxyl-CoA dehydrogenase